MREAKRIAHETAFKKGTERAKHQLSYQQTQYTKILHVLRSQLLKASEQERAAYALASAKKSITLLAERLEQHAISTSTSKPTRNNAVSISSSASVGELTDRASRLEASVVSRSHEILSQVLVSAPSLQPEIQDAQNEAAEMSCRQLRSRVFGHVLRTLHVLGHGEVALSILAENIVYPLAR